MENEIPKIGSTGKFPQGKLNKDDEGELALRIGHDMVKELVIIEFGKNVSWLALDPATALQLSKTIAEKAVMVLKKPKIIK